MGRKWRIDWKTPLTIMEGLTLICCLLGTLLGTVRDTMTVQFSLVGLNSSTGAISEGYSSDPF